MKTDHLGDLFHSLGFRCGCSKLKCQGVNSGIVLIAYRNVISFIYNTAAQAECKQTRTGCKTVSQITYTN